MRFTFSDARRSTTCCIDPGQSGMLNIILTRSVPFFRNVMDNIHDSGSTTSIAVDPSMFFNMSEYPADVSKTSPVIVTGAPCLSCALQLSTAFERNTLPMSACFTSMWSNFDTDGSPASFNALNVSESMSASPAKLRSTSIFQIIVVSDMAFRDVEFRMLIILDPRKPAACAVAPGTSRMYIVTCVSVL
jgi:hypothetical protein